MPGDTETSPIGSRTEGPAYCCLEHAALDALSVPIVIHDLDTILFANRATVAVEPNVQTGAPLSALSTPDAMAASAERRQFMLAAHASVGDVSTKIPNSRGGFHSIVTRGVPFAYGDDKTALVQLIRVIDGDVRSSYEPDEAQAPYLSSQSTGACIHQAAYDVLPVPSSIIDRTTLHRANREFRLMLRSSSSLRNKPVEAVLHPDFLQPADERRHLVIDLGAPVTGASVKFRAFDSADVFSLVDASRIEYNGDSYMATLIVHSTRV